jgi:hypothetical protein
MEKFSPFMARLKLTQPSSSPPESIVPISDGGVNIRTDRNTVSYSPGDKYFPNSAVHLLIQPKAAK